MDSENIQGEDVIKLVLQFCKEHGLQKTASALAEEADSQTNFIKDHQKFQAAFRSGQWDFILTEIEGMVLPRELLMDLFEQVIFELCELGEYDLARHIVKLLVQKSMDV
jgi:WD40 repeat-containing protein SMU1